MFEPNDVYLAIERDQLGQKLHLSSGYHTTEKWTKDSLEYKVLMDFLASGGISYGDIFDRLKILAEKEFDKQYENPNDTPIYVYLTALAELNEPYSETTQEKYHKGCQIVHQVEHLHWARRHVMAWANHVKWERSRPTD